MSDEVTGRAVELTAIERGDLAAAYGWWRAHGDPEAFYDTLDAAVERILADRIAQAHREGAAEAERKVAAVEQLASFWESSGAAWGSEYGAELRAALRGDA